MCYCDQPNTNGQFGYSWDGAHRGVRNVNPPDLQEGEELLFDEPGRCGRQCDSHSHHFRVVGGCAGHVALLVRHGGGDERYSLGYRRDHIVALAVLSSDDRYWLLNAIYHSLHDHVRDARADERRQWQVAFIDKRIKRRTRQGRISVWIEPKPVEASA